MPIEYEGLSDRRSTSRMGKFRLGRKATNAKGKEYPEKIDYFRADPDNENLLPIIHKLVGEKPRSLRIMLISDDREQVFPQYLKRYATSKAGKPILICKGTGGRDESGAPLPAITRLDSGTGELIEDHPCDPENCPDYQAGKCKRLASLSFVLRDFPALRVWQIDTTSQISIQRINTRLNDLAALSAAAGRPGRLAGIPLVLTLGPVQVKPPGAKRRLVVYCLDMDLDQKALMTGQDPMAAFLAPLAQSVGPPDEKEPPDGLYARSQVEEGADPIAERIETAKKQEAQEEQEEDDILADLPEDIAQGLKNIGLTRRQARLLATRFVGEGFQRLTESRHEKFLSYLSGLADLKAAGDDASFNVFLKSLDLDEMGEANVVGEETEEQVETPADSVQEAAASLGLDI